MPDADAAGLVHEAERRLGILRTDLDHVDAVLRMFDQDTKPEAIRAKALRQPSSSPTVPNLSRKVLDLLRIPDKPLTAYGIARTLRRCSVSRAMTQASSMASSVSMMNVA